MFGHFLRVLHTLKTLPAKIIKQTFLSIFRPPTQLFLEDTYEKRSQSTSSILNHASWQNRRKSYSVTQIPCYKKRWNWWLTVQLSKTVSIQLNVFYIIGMFRCATSDTRLKYYIYAHKFKYRNAAAWHQCFTGISYHVVQWLENVS